MGFAKNYFKILLEDLHLAIILLEGLPNKSLLTINKGIIQNSKWNNSHLMQEQLKTQGQQENAT